MLKYKQMGLNLLNTELNGRFTRPPLLSRSVHRWVAESPSRIGMGQHEESDHTLQMHTLVVVLPISTTAWLSLMLLPILTILLGGALQ